MIFSLNRQSFPYLATFYLFPALFCPTIFARFQDSPQTLLSIFFEAVFILHPLMPGNWTSSIPPFLSCVIITFLWLVHFSPEIEKCWTVVLLMGYFSSFDPLHLSWFATGGIFVQAGLITPFSEIPSPPSTYPLATLPFGKKAALLRFLFWSPFFFIVYSCHHFSVQFGLT